MTDVLLRDRGAEAVKGNLKFCQQANLNLYNTCTTYKVTAGWNYVGVGVSVSRLAEGMARFQFCICNNTGQHPYYTCLIV